MPDVLILGNSSIARRRVIPALAALDEVGGVHVASIRSRPSPDPARKVTRVFDSYEAALGRSPAGYAYVSTVNSDHHEWVCRALASGRRVVVDKPAGTTREQVEDMAARGARSGLVVAEATVYPFHPMTEALRERLAPSGVRVAARFSIPARSAGDSRYRPDLGGGGVNDFGPYAVSLGRVLFGRDAEFSSRVMAGLDDEGPVLDRLATVARAYVRYAEEHPEQYRVLFMGPAGPPPPDAPPTPGALALGLVVGVLEQGIRVGDMRPVDLRALRLRCSPLIRQSPTWRSREDRP